MNLNMVYYSKIPSSNIIKNNNNQNNNKIIIVKVLIKIENKK